MSAQPTIVTAAVIERAGRFLVARKADGGPRAGLWEFPGGKVEPDESHADALARECAEELGVVVSVGRPVAVVVWDYADVSVELHAYACTIVDGVPAPLEHAELRWVTAGDIAALRLSDADVPIARRLIERS
ncbi:MAG: (deoxy)nucleoside triphosphate pyrophosphohydrolase [Spirochaetota bacterium]